MKFRVGDKVKFLHDTGQGEISAIIDKNKVMVRTDDGFDVPYVVTDLVKYGEMENRRLSGIEDEESDSTDTYEEKQESSESYIEEMDEEPVEDEEIVFALTLSSRGNDILSFLVNSSSYNLYYTVSQVISGEDNLLSRGVLEADTKVRISKLVPTVMNEEILIRINLLFWNQSFYKFIKPVNQSLKIDLKEILSGLALSENDYFDEKASILVLHSFKEKANTDFENKIVEDNLKAAIAEKEKKVVKQKPVRAQRHPEIEEVDLHIESIVDEAKGLTSGEILELQMSRFKTSLETAIIHKTRRIVFIHGIGNGKLKHELRRTLERKYPDLKYQDASFKEYGYGATMVIIPQ
ncbi:MAG: DUF2027 domain-containing protein [Bacteroidales bacterium]